MSSRIVGIDVAVNDARRHPTHAVGDIHAAGQPKRTHDTNVDITGLRGHKVSVRADRK